ncbi:transposase [Streptomyces sp. NBC_01334]|uniref:transposase n=1 Tax=Streptomyces sp. NBC_01334 TaxID=2903827 RepID=UPI003FA3CAE5
MLPVVGSDLTKRLVPDELCEPAAMLLPSFAARPQGGGTVPCAERAVFTAVVYALTSGGAWRHRPPTVGTSPATARRRFTVWTEAGLWRRLHRAVARDLLDDHSGEDVVGVGVRPPGAGLEARACRVAMATGCCGDQVV